MTEAAPMIARPPLSVAVPESPRVPARRRECTLALNALAIVGRLTRGAFKQSLQTLQVEETDGGGHHHSSRCQIHSDAVNARRMRRQ